MIVSDAAALGKMCSRLIRRLARPLSALRFQAVIFTHAISLFSLSFTSDLFSIARRSLSMMSLEATRDGREKQVVADISAGADRTRAVA